MPVNLYEDQMARYESARLERLNPSLQQNNNSYAYDLSGSQTWNPNGFANAQSLGGIRSASASLKPNARGRTGLPTVCILFMIQHAGVEKFSIVVTLLSLTLPWDVSSHRVFLPVTKVPQLTHFLLSR
jgi:hypothetical protein